MGLDWNPLGRPRAGHEAEFEALFKRLGDLPVNVGWLEKLSRRLRKIDRDALDRRWQEIQVTPYEALGAPRVGEDDAADAWARARYRDIKDPTLSEDTFLRDMRGYYVLQLAPPCDGLPCYTNGYMGYVELFSFRAQFLRDCESILPASTLDKCYVSCLAPGLSALSAELRAAATRHADELGVRRVEAIMQPTFDSETPEGRAHILFAAAKWGEYWSSRGHGMEAYW